MQLSDSALPAVSFSGWNVNGAVDATQHPEVEAAY